MAQLPETGITTHLVRTALGTNKTDVGALCTSGRINMWSRWKPVRCSKYAGISLDDIKAANFGLALEDDADLNYNTNDPESTVPIKKWVYLRPDGTPYPYRLGDFRKYKHDAQPPIRPVETDVFWNMANDRRIPVVDFRFRYDGNTRTSQGTDYCIDTDGLLAPDGHWQYFIALLYIQDDPFHGSLNDPYIMNAIAPVSDGGNIQEAARIDLNKYSVSNFLYPDPNNTPRYGKFVFQAVLNKLDMQGRNYGHVMDDAGIDTAAVSRYNNNHGASGYNGAEGGLAHFPVPTRVNLYVFTLFDWSYCVTGNVVVSSPISNLAFTITPSDRLNPCVLSQSGAASFLNAYGSGQARWTVYRMQLHISAKRQEITIDGKRFQNEDTGGQVVIDLDELQYVIAGIAQDSHSHAHIGLPTLYQYKKIANGQLHPEDVVYVIDIPERLMDGNIGHQFYPSTHPWFGIYNENGNVIGIITAKGTVAVGSYGNVPSITATLASNGNTATYVRTGAAGDKKTTRIENLRNYFIGGNGDLFGFGNDGSRSVTVEDNTETTVSLCLVNQTANPDYVLQPGSGPHELLFRMVYNDQLPDENSNPSTPRHFVQFE